MARVDLVMRIRMDGEYLAHELMRVALQGIVDTYREDPFAMQAADAAGLAEQVLERVRELEADRP